MERNQKDLSPSCSHSWARLQIIVSFKEFQYSRIPPKWILSTFVLFSSIFMCEHIRVELSSEAPSVKSSHFIHWRAALRSLALQNLRKVSPTSWLQGPLKATLFCVVNASLPDIQIQVPTAKCTSLFLLELRISKGKHARVTSRSHWPPPRGIKESGDNGGATAGLLSPIHFLCTYWPQQAHRPPLSSFTGLSLSPSPL